MEDLLLRRRDYILKLVLFVIGQVIGVSVVCAKPLNEPIKPIPSIDFTKRSDEVKLGRMLFEETLLSKDNSISCSSCHDLSRGGADGKSHSVGVNGSVGGINAPSVFNSGLNFRQFWDGRAVSLEDQVDGPVQHPKEMGAKWTGVVERLKQRDDYVKEFNKIYPDGLNKKNIKKAIATFERALLTPNAKFDSFLKGNSKALTSLEKIGYKNFKSYGCISCHQGVNVGGNMYQTMGVMGQYFVDRGGKLTPADLGRFNVTKVESDKHVFRVPSLRNVELTAPYFHDGSVATLEEAVSKMAKYQLGVELSQEDQGSIVKFLKTLTGEAPVIVSKKGKK